MGFQAAAVVIEGAVDTAEVLDVVGWAAGRVGCGGGQVIVAPRLALPAFPGAELGFVAVLPRRVVLGADLLAHALHRRARRRAVAVAASDFFQAGAYELCGEGAGGLVVVGAVGVGAGRITYGEVPALGVAALVGRAAEGELTLAGLFDAAEASAGWFTVPRRDAPARRVPPSRRHDPNEMPWGWALCAVDPEGARRRYGVVGGV